MVTDFEQYGNYAVYLHANCRIVRNNDDYDDYSESKCDFVVYSSSANLFRSDFGSFTNHF